MFFRKDLFFLLYEVFAATRKPSLFVAGAGGGGTDHCGSRAAPCGAPVVEHSSSVCGGEGGTGHCGSWAAPHGAPVVEHSSSVCGPAPVVVAHWLSSSTAAGVLLRQGLNPWPLHEKVGS